MTPEEIEKRLNALEGLEKRITALEDVEEIKTLTRHYANSLVTVNWDELIDCFTDDAVVEIGIAGARRGKTALNQLFKKEIGTRHIGKEHVLVLHPEIVLKGEKAEGRWIIYFMFTEASHIKTMEWVHGLYHFDYEKKDGRWKISYLKWTQRLGPLPFKLMEIYQSHDKK